SHDLFERADGLMEGLLRPCPVPPLDVVVPVNVIEPVNADLMTPLPDLPQERLVSPGYLRARKEETPHEGLYAECFDDTRPAGLRDEAAPREDALHGPSRMVLAHGGKKGGPDAVSVKEVEQARHAVAHPF